jgi:hypothetical protein
MHCNVPFENIENVVWSEDLGLLWVAYISKQNASKPASAFRGFTAR